MPICKAGQDHLSVSDPPRGGRPSFDRVRDLNQLIASFPAGVQAGLPSGVNRSGDQVIEVLKGHCKG